MYSGPSIHASFTESISNIEFRTPGTIISDGSSSSSDTFICMEGGTRPKRASFLFSCLTCTSRTLRLKFLFHPITFFSVDFIEFSECVKYPAYRPCTAAKMTKRRHRVTRISCPPRKRLRRNRKKLCVFTRNSNLAHRSRQM